MRYENVADRTMPFLANLVAAMIPREKPPSARYHAMLTLAGEDFFVVVVRAALEYGTELN